MKVGTETKSKFKKLQRRLGVPMWQCMGLLEAIWQLTASSAPNGGLGKLTNEDIAAAIEWSGNENDLITMLIETGWLDVYDDPSIRFVVHDWADHCPNFVKANEAQGYYRFLVRPTTERNTTTKKRAPKVKPKDGSSDYPTKPSHTNSSQANSNQAPPKPPFGDGGDFWKPAERACEEIGFNTAGARRVIALCREKGISPAEVVGACRFATKDRYDNPPGAVTRWAEAHDPKRTVDDPRSWPTPKVPLPRGPTGPTPEQQRQSLLSESVRLADAGKVHEAVAMLERAKIPEGDWPLRVTSKLEKA